jgi:hypothetical protein
MPLLAKPGKEKPRQSTPIPDKKRNGRKSSTSDQAKPS